MLACLKNGLKSLVAVIEIMRDFALKCKAIKLWQSCQARFTWQNFLVK